MATASVTRLEMRPNVNKPPRTNDTSVRMGHNAGTTRLTVQTSAAFLSTLTVEDVGFETNCRSYPWERKGEYKGESEHGSGVRS